MLTNLRLNRRASAAPARLAPVSLNFVRLNSVRLAAPVALLCMAGSLATISFAQTTTTTPPPPPPPAHVHVAPAPQAPRPTITPAPATRPVSPPPASAPAPAPTYVHPSSDSSRPGPTGNLGYAPRSVTPVAPANGGANQPVQRPAPLGEAENQRNRGGAPSAPPAASPAPTAPAPANSGAIIYTPRTYTPESGNPNRPGEPNRSAPTPTTNYTPLPRSSAPSPNPAQAPYTPLPRTQPSNPATAPVVRPIPYSPESYNNNRPATPGNAPSSAAPRMQTRPVYNVNSGAVAGTTPTGATNLNSNGSRQVLSDVNSSRARFAGINNRPIPQGNVTVQPTGHLVVAAGNGREYNVRPNGTIASFHAPNTEASFRPSGRIESFRTPTMTVTNAGHGERVVMTQRPDRSMVVSIGHNTGYVQRPVVVGGVTYQQRTWVYGGGRGDHDRDRSQRTAVYAPYRYNGVSYYHYVPRYTYAPAFYGWAYYGWGQPHRYRWAWYNDPWYSYYGGYYSPTLEYVSAGAWLADFYLSQTLANGYQQYDPNQAPDAGYGYSNGQPPPPDGYQQGGYQQGGEDLYAQTDTPISPALKEQIAQEVQQQIAMENAASNQPGQAYNLTDLPQVMQPNHVFVVSQPLNVITADQLACSLSAGNVLQLQSPPDAGAPAAALAVVSSRRGDCPAGVQVTVALSDLEEMQNNFRAQLDSGLSTLHDQQGQNGLPPAPESAIAPPPRPAPDLPTDNENVQALVAQQQQQAAQAEQQVTQQAFPPPQ